MAWAYDDGNEAEYRPADQGVRFWLQDMDAADDLGRRAAFVIGRPALQRLGGDGDREHMIATFHAHQDRIVTAALRKIGLEGHAPVPEATRLSYEDLSPA